MIVLTHLDEGKLIQAQMDLGADALPPDTIWIDLLEPSREEELVVEKRLGINVPTHDEMQEIETSSRLYTEGGAIVMTMSVLDKPSVTECESSPITFILYEGRLLTVRYVDPVPFPQFIQKIKRHPELAATGNQALVGILEQISDCLADVLEGATTDLENISRLIFSSDHKGQKIAPDFNQVIYKIGHVGDLATKAKGSLLNLTRLLLFFAGQSNVNNEVKERMRTLMQDASSIDEHARFLSAKVGFLMEATMGLINLEQNNTIKIFSVVAVIFLPPTLIASIYGMNFEYMPELHWIHGYPFALMLMLFSGIMPLWVFWRKKWL